MLNAAFTYSLENAFLQVIAYLFTLTFWYKSNLSLSSSKVRTYVESRSTIDFFIKKDERDAAFLYILLILFFTLWM